MKTYKQFKENLILLESLSKSRDKYLEVIGQRDFDQLVDIDPTKQKKYLLAICSFFVEDDAKIDHMKEYIEIYDKLLQRNLIKQKDINRFKSYGDFVNYVDMNKNNHSEREIKELTKTKGIEVLIDNDDVWVARIDSYEASCIYGYRTKWCISMKHDRFNWDDFTHSYGVTFYFIINKTINDDDDPLYKMVVSVNLNDRIIDIRDLYDKVIDDRNLTNMGLDLDMFVASEAVKNSPLRLFKVYFYIHTGELVVNEDGSYSVLGSDSVVTLNKHTGIKSFEDLPFKLDTIEGTFKCIDRELVSLKGGPKIVMGDYSVKGHFTEEDVRAVCDVRNNVYTY